MSRAEHPQRISPSRSNLADAQTEGSESIIERALMNVHN